MHICFPRDVQGPSDPKEGGSASLIIAINCKSLEINLTEYPQPCPPP